VLDNLSSLGRGLDENDNSAQDDLLSWLIRLRYRGYTLLIVHHAGKGGDQRGASRREDLLNTTIKLESAASIHEPGARFKLKFTKTRGGAPNPAELDLHLRRGSNGYFELMMVRDAKPKAALITLRAIFTFRPKTQAKLALHLHKTQVAVSNDCKALRKEGLLAKGVSITAEGLKAIEEQWPGTTGSQGSFI
jgi:hypothetical protein